MLTVPDWLLQVEIREVLHRCVLVLRNWYPNGVVAVRLGIILHDLIELTSKWLLSILLGLLVDTQHTVGSAQEETLILDKLELEFFLIVLVQFRGGYERLV